jgi:hypothetical protein
MVLASCEEVLENEFKNPDKFGNVEGAIPGMFTAMLNQGTFYIKDYGEWWNQLTDGTGIVAYSQISERYVTDRYTWFKEYHDVTNGNGFNDTHVRNWFENFYVKLKNWAFIRDNVTLLQGEQQINAKVYYDLATIMKDWAALRNVDLFNSIPYFEAFRGSEGFFTAKYDDPKLIYRDILDELKEISERLPAEYDAMSSTAKAELTNQDIALKGNVEQWIQYANAVRLRAAVRLAGVDRDFAVAHIEDIIAKGNLPTADLQWQIPVVDPPNAGGLWMRGLYEASYATFIPKVMLNAMMGKKNNKVDSVYEVGVDDPRLPVIAMPTKYKDYRPVTMDADWQKAGYLATEKYYGTQTATPLSSFLEQNSKSMYSHVTFMYNKFPAYMMSLAEVDLLLAEAVLKGLATTGKSAGEHMYDAVIHSTDYWYYINSLSTYADNVADAGFKNLLKPAKPDAASIAAYANTIKTNFEAAVDEEAKMEILMLQKYVHINMVEPYELFTDLRRTRHPKLEPFKLGNIVMTPQPERLRYPTSEFETNTENYLEVAGQDNFTTPVFWVPTNKISESYYQQ